jgi:hypothetical protein
MKKTPILLFLTVFVICVQAQTIIPKAGFTLSRIKFEEGDEYQKNKAGFTLGVGVNFELGEIFSLQPELNFIQKGARLELNEEFLDTRIHSESKITINYLEIPVLARASFGNSTRFYVSAGPSLGIGMGGKYYFEETTSYMGFSETENNNRKIKFGDEPSNYNPETDDYVYIPKRLDVGLQIAIGTIIAEKVMIDIRYGIGLTNLNDEDENNNDDDDSLYNRTFQFTVGIPINLK